VLAGFGVLLVLPLAHADDEPSPDGDDTPDATPNPPPAATPVPSAAAPLAPDENAALRAELARQASALEALRAHEEQREQTDDARAKALRFSGYLQVDWVAYDQASVDEVNASTRAPLNENRFTLRRGHLRLDAERGLLAGALEIDANTNAGPQVRPIDAEISLRSAERVEPKRLHAMLTAGLFKIPFGFEVQELDVDRPFLERSTVARALFPGEFDLGARVWLRYRFLDLKLAAMNGHPLGERTFPALDPASAKDLVGRLGVAAEIAPKVALDAGVSFERGMGFHEGTPTTKDQLTWRDDNGDGIVQATEIQVIPGSSATASELFRRFALGADVRVAVQLARGFGLEVRAEVMRAENLDRGVEPADPIGAGYDLREFGYSAGITQELTSLALVGVRYDRYNPDQDAREQQALAVVPRDRSYETLALLAMLRYDGARLALEYDHNKNALGRDPSGKPTTLGRDALTVRAQLRF
jgi:hypothetical protein